MLQADAPVAASDGPRVENELDEPTKSAKEDDATQSTKEADAPGAARDGPRLENELDEPTKSAKEDGATQSTKEAMRVLKYKREQHKRQLSVYPGV